MSVPRHNIIVLSVATAIATAIWIIPSRSAKDNKHATIFKSACGWGYDILVEDKLFIHQESVPSLTGHQGFATREMAEKAAALVLEKLQQKQLPSLTNKDLQTIAPLEALRYDTDRTNQ